MGLLYGMYILAFHGNMLQLTRSFLLPYYPLSSGFLLPFLKIAIPGSLQDTIYFLCQLITKPHFPLCLHLQIIQYKTDNTRLKIQFYNQGDWLAALVSFKSRKSGPILWHAWTLMVNLRKDKEHSSSGRFLTSNSGVWYRVFFKDQVSCLFSLCHFWW